LLLETHLTPAPIYIPAEKPVVRREFRALLNVVNRTAAKGSTGNVPHPDESKVKFCSPGGLPVHFGG
jgi:hypothetical protein